MCLNSVIVRRTGLITKYDKMTNSKEVYYLGVDWGLKKTGLAIADNELRIATALKEVLTGDLLVEIGKIKDKLPLKTVIFGDLGFADQYQTSKEVLKEKENCVNAIKEIGLDVVKVEEIFTTRMAQANLVEAGRKKVTKMDNSESAKIILQTWLEGGRSC